MYLNLYDDMEGIEGYKRLTLTWDVFKCIFRI